MEGKWIHAYACMGVEIGFIWDNDLDAHLQWVRKTWVQASIYLHSSTSSFGYGVKFGMCHLNSRPMFSCCEYTSLKANTLGFHVLANIVTKIIRMQNMCFACKE
jgi:hypothetical protein